jgi:hypothetical protein
MLAERTPPWFALFQRSMDHEDGPLVFQHACKLGLEGIVSKRRDSFYSSGRSPHWIKSKDPNAAAVKREAEEDWGEVLRFEGGVTTSSGSWLVQR